MYNLVMNAETIVKNAIDGNAFISTTASAGFINPEYWNRELLQHVEETIIIQSYAKVYDDILGQDGASFNVTIGVEPAKAEALVETVDVPISEYTKTQVVFTPTEYGAAYQLTDKEARRAFFDVARDMTNELGYSLALNREEFARDLLRTGAGSNIVANGVAPSLIASTDELTYDLLVTAVATMRANKLMPRVLFVSPGQKAQLAKQSDFREALKYGGRETILGGVLDRVYGIQIVECTTLAPASGNKSKAILLGYDAQGRPSFGIGRKALPRIGVQRWERGRYTDLVATEEWDMKVLRANGLITLETYDA